MTITIPAGSLLLTADGVAMHVVDESVGEVVDYDARRGIVTVKFEDGEEYTVSRARIPGPIYTNPGNNVTSRNGVKVQGSLTGGQPNNPTGDTPS